MAANPKGTGYRPLSELFAISGRSKVQCRFQRTSPVGCYLIPLQGVADLIGDRLLGLWSRTEQLETVMDAMWKSAVPNWKSRGLAPPPQ